MARDLHKCTAKACRVQSSSLYDSFRWVLSRRGILRVTDETLHFGDWTIPYTLIDEAVLFRIRQMFIPGYVLRVRSRGFVYQFGLNFGRFWEGELPFEAERKRARIRLTPVRILLRVLFVAIVAYWIWRIFF
jgi:hypothetical protein